MSLSFCVSILPHFCPVMLCLTLIHTSKLLFELTRTLINNLYLFLYLLPLIQQFVLPYKRHKNLNSFLGIFIYSVYYFFVIGFRLKVLLLINCKMCLTLIILIIISICVDLYEMFLKMHSIILEIMPVLSLLVYQNCLI